MTCASFCHSAVHSPVSCLQVVALVRVYMQPLYASLYLEVLFRPLNKILIAQRIIRPQLYIAMFTFALHWPITHTLMVGPCCMRYALTAISGCQAI